MKKLLLLLSNIAILSSLSFTAHAQSEVTKKTGRVITTHSVGKPGYNRHKIMIYKKDSIADINSQILSNAPAAGLVTTKSMYKVGYNTRKNIRGMRHHP